MTYSRDRHANSAAMAYPCDIEAEQSVLGSILVSPWSAEQSVPLMAAGDFYRPEHQRIFAAIAALMTRGDGVDLVTVRSELARSPQKDTLPPGYLQDLTQASVGRGNVVSQVRIVKDHATRRRLMIAAMEISARAQDLEEDLAEVVTRSEGAVLEATAQERGGDSFATVPQLLPGVVADIEERGKSDAPYFGLSTGIRSYDLLTLGLEPGGLYTIAGRPAMGKTSAGISILANVGTRGQRGVFFSLEMPKYRIVQRFLAAVAGVSLGSIRRGRFTAEESLRLERAQRILELWPIAIDDTSALTVSAMVSRARRMRSELGGLDLVVVDYLQIVKPSSSGAGSNRAYEVQQIANDLKAMAKTLEVPVIALAQINRGVESRQDKRPMLSDLKESGGIEEASDAVTLLYRPAYYCAPDQRPDPTQGEEAEWIVAKARDGETGTARVSYFGPYTRFDNVKETHDRF